MIDRAGLRLSGKELLWLVATVFALLYVTAIAILLGALGATYAFHEGKRGLVGVYAVATAVAVALELSRL